MKKIPVIVSAVSAAVCFILCLAVLADSSGIHGLITDGRNVFDAGASVREEATFGVVVSALSFVAIVVGQLLGKKAGKDSDSRSAVRIMSFTVAFVLMSLLALAFTVRSYHQLG